jgi:hypothetical protein
MKKIFVRALGIAIVVVLTGGMFAFAGTQKFEDRQNVEGLMPEMPVIQTLYGSFTGTVKEVFPSDRSAEAVQRVAVEGEEGDEAIFLIGAGTIWATDVTAVTAGDKVTGFYDGKAPMLMIYPPQYNIEVIAVNLGENTEITVDRFNDKLISSTGIMQMRIGEHIEVLTPEGDMFKDDNGFANRVLVVLHDPLGDGLDFPIQTQAWKIIVMYEKAVPVDNDNKQSIEAVMGNVAEMDIIVNDVKIDAPDAYQKDSVVMVPLRAIAEALGFTVQWEGSTQSIMLNNSISLSIGKDYYTFARMAPIELGTAPELKNGHTYVPLQFFTGVAGLNNAYVFEGQIVIDDSEKME